MAHRENIEALNMLLRDLCLPNVPFGGKIVVLGGDFRQTMPVVPKKTQQEVIEYRLVCSPLWPLFTRLHLTEIKHPCTRGFTIFKGFDCTWKRCITINGKRIDHHS